MDVLEGFAHLIKRVWATGTTFGSCFSTFELREAVTGAGFSRAELHLIYMCFLGVPRQVELMWWEDGRGRDPAKVPALRKSNQILRKSKQILP